MSTIQKIVWAIACLLLTTTVFGQSKDEIAKLQQVLENVVSAWTPYGELNTESADEMETWIPEYGVRGKYFINKTKLGLKMAETLVGAPVYSSGPHKEHPDYASKDYGHYNPDFLKRLDKMLKTILKNKTFVSKAQEVYNTHFMLMMRAYWKTYTFVTKTDIDNTRANLDKLGTDFDFQEFYRAAADSFEEQDMVWYETNVACGFWLRRVADGTDKAFYQLLKTVMTAFDKQGMK